jgi:hypothetical protein
MSCTCGAGIESGSGILGSSPKLGNSLHELRLSGLGDGWDNGSTKQNVLRARKTSANIPMTGSSSSGSGCYHHHHHHVNNVTNSGKKKKNHL